MQLAITQFCLKNGILSAEKEQTILITHVKEVRSILGLFQSQREELQYSLS